MPTPSPIIVARVGPLDGMATAWPTSPITDRAIPSPALR